MFHYFQICVKAFTFCIIFCVEKNRFQITSVGTNGPNMTKQTKGASLIDKTNQKYFSILLKIGLNNRKACAYSKYIYINIVVDI